MLDPTLQGKTCAYRANKHPEFRIQIINYIDNVSVQCLSEVMLFVRTVLCIYVLCSRMFLYVKTEYCIFYIHIYCRDEYFLRHIKESLTAATVLTQKAQGAFLRSLQKERERRACTLYLGNQAARQLGRYCQQLVGDTPAHSLTTHIQIQHRYLAGSAKQLGSLSRPCPRQTV